MSIKLIVPTVLWADFTGMLLLTSEVNLMFVHSAGKWSGYPGCERHRCVGRSGKRCPLYERRNCFQLTAASGCSISLERIDEVVSAHLGAGRVPGK